jgi:hypothetical protein
MTEQFAILPRRNRRRAVRSRRIATAFQPLPSGQAAPALSFPIPFHEPESSRRTLLSGSLAALLHFGTLGLLILAASLAPMIEEELIPVQLLPQETPQEEEPAPAPKALAERRSLNYAPARAVAPQIVNPRVIADAVPAVSAEALQMDALASSATPTQITRSTTVVERVSAVQSAFSARATAVDVARVGAPVVRGPVQVTAPVGPSVGPRAVTVADAGESIGTATLEIGEGSSVRQGVVSSRDVIGSPTGPLLISVDTEVGEGFLRGAGGGTGTGSGSTASLSCLQRPEVRAYMDQVKERMLARWKLPPGVPADQSVKLRFELDVAGSASAIDLIRATSNALGASAVDALRAASPFPPLPDRARCLAQFGLTGTFTNPGAS